MDTEIRYRASGTGTQVLDSPAPEAIAAPAAIGPAPASLTGTVAYLPPAAEVRPAVGPIAAPGPAPVRVSIPILAGMSLVLIAGAAVLLLSSWLADVSTRQQAAHGGVGPTTTFVRTLDAGGADTAQIDLSIGQGTLAVAGGARELLDTRITSNVVDWHPQVRYDVRPTPFDVQHNTGLLVMEQAPITFVPTGVVRNEWDLQLNSSLPLALKLQADLGAVDTNLQLGHLNLTRLEVSSGPGPTVIDLTGTWTHDVHIRLYGGTGQIRLILPASTGAQVTTAGGPGTLQAPGWQVNGDTYTNAGYGQGSTLWIYAKLGGGNIVLAQAP
jgi:hypothetical protein